jgi:cytochrome c-type biogenesis protein CcmH
VVALGVFLLWLVPLASPPVGAMTAPPAAVGLDGARAADALSHELMSPFCPQLLLADCRSESAGVLRGEIRDALARGERPADIRAALVARFGERILAAPPQRGFGLVAWLTPPAFVLAGLIWMVLRLWSRPSPRLCRVAADRRSCAPTAARARAPRVVSAAREAGGLRDVPGRRRPSRGLLLETPQPAVDPREARKSSAPPGRAAPTGSTSARSSAPTAP